MWQAFYAGSLAFIKSSICITLMRITQQKRYLMILRGLIILSASLSVVGLIVIVNQCHPLDRYWDKRVPGTCWPPIIATALSYAASVSNVITDFCVAAIPFFLLRNVQMRSKIKLYVRLILGLGILYERTQTPLAVYQMGKRLASFPVLLLWYHRADLFSLYLLVLVSLV